MQTTTTQTALKWGAIIGVFSIIQSVIGFVFNLDPTQGAYKWIASVLGIAVAIIGIVMAMRSFKEDNEGFMSYGQGLGIGAMMGGISGLIGGIFNYFYQTFIDPSFTEKIKEAQLAAMEEKGMSSEQIDQAMGIMNMFSNPSMTIVFAILGSILVYFLVSLIVSAVQKNEKPVFD